MRNGTSAIAIIAMLGLAASPARAQGDLLDFGDEPESEQPADEAPSEPESPPDTESPEGPEDETPSPPSVEDEPTIDEPGLEDEEIDEPALGGDGDNEPSDSPGDSSDGEASSNAADSQGLDPAQLDKIKAVPRKAVLKKGRLELAPLASLSVNDAFYQHLAVGGSLVYYPHDSFGIGVGVDYLYENLETSNVDDVRQGLTSVPAQFEQPELFAHLDLYWVPIYGKVSLFDRNILHFEFYATGGLGIASALDDDVQPAANIGLGQRLFFSDWFALRVEARNHVYLTTQTVDRVERSDIQNIVMLYLGASFFIPPSFEYSFL